MLRQNSLMLIALMANAGCSYAIQLPTSAERNGMRKLAPDGNDVSSDSRELKRKAEELREKGDLGANGFAHPDFRSAQAFCKNIQVYGNSASSVYAGFGWPLSFIGATGAGALIAFSAKTDDKTEAALGGGGAALSAAFAVLGTYLLSRSSAANRAAAEAGAQLTAKEDDAWRKCIEARVKWQASNSDSKDAAVAGIKAIPTTVDSSKKDGDEKKQSTDASAGGGDKNPQGTAPSGSSSTETPNK